MPEALQAKDPLIKPPVSVHQITRGELEKLIGTDRGVDLGGQHSFLAGLTEIQVNVIQAALKRGSDKFYVLDWNGNKIPRGVVLEGHEIGWTQHGVVSSTDGETMGNYDRMIEFGGEDGKQQRMIVYMMSPKPEFPTHE